MIPPFEHGLLPIGRFPATQAEVATQFVTDAAWATSTTRNQIWQDWLVALAWVKNVLPVPCVWLGGSFLTSKTDPDDLDVVFVLDARQAAAVADPFDRAFLLLVSSGKAFRHSTGKRLDTFVINWVPDPDGQKLAPGFAQYADARGYWDDLWQRKIAGPKSSPRVPADALPRRGYLEVVVDGFTA